MDATSITLSLPAPLPVGHRTAPFTTLLKLRIKAAHTRLCVGLDPDLTKLPLHLRAQPEALLQFCVAIVEATAPWVCAFKPQIAYFASQRAEDQLAALIAHIRTHHPAIPVILDAKRGDIGATAEHYAREAFERYDAHAVTLSPLMGFDSLAPFLAWRDRGAFLLCRTSNPGGDALQMLKVDGERLFERIARLAAGQWNTHAQCGLVVGATYPAELTRVRAIAPGLPLLVPGIGAQGGDVQAIMRAERAGQQEAKQEREAKAQRSGELESAGEAPMVINSSRAILYASSGEDFALAARAAAQRTCDEINAADPES